jgi:hypothetical protein
MCFSRRYYPSTSNLSGTLLFVSILIIIVEYMYKTRDHDDDDDDDESEGILYVDVFFEDSFQHWCLHA